MWEVRGEKGRRVGVAAWVGGSSGLGGVTDGTYRTHGTYGEVQAERRIAPTLGLDMNVLPCGR